MIVNEKLLTLGGVAYPKFGNVLILAGGGGSGKGWSFSHLIGFEGKVINVDDISGSISKAIGRNKESAFARNLENYINDGYWMDFSPVEQITPEYIDSVIARLHKDRPKDSNHFFDEDDPRDVSLRYHFQKFYNYDDRIIDKVASSADKRRLPNLIVDTTLGKYGKIKQVCDVAIKYGYEPQNIHIVWILTPIYRAIQRNDMRSRKVNRDILVSGHRSVYKTFRKIFGLDPVSISDNLQNYMDGDIWIVFSDDNDTSTISKKHDDGKKSEVISEYTACKIKSKFEPVVPISKVPNLPVVGGRYKGTVGSRLAVYSQLELLNDYM